MGRTIASVVFGGLFGAVVAVIVVSAGRDAGTTSVESDRYGAAIGGDETYVLAPTAAALEPPERPLVTELADLAALTWPAERRAAALAWVEAAGADRDAIARAAAALPPADRLNFTFDAIALVALRDAGKALELAVGLDDRAARTEAVARIARALGVHDAAAGLSYANSIEDYALRDTYVVNLLEVLAGADVDGFFALVARSDLRNVTFTAETFESIAAVDPERQLARLDALPPGMRRAARSVAIQTLVRNDPDAAFRHIESLPRADRSSLLMSTARAFALHDTEAALRWVYAQRPPASQIVAGVLQGIAEQEPVRAADLLLQALAPGGALEPSLHLATIMASFTPGPRESLAIVADRFSFAGERGAAAFGSLMDYWSQNDPEAAYSWARTHVDRLTDVALDPFLRNLAATRRDLAKEAVAWLPTDVYAVALRTVTSTLALADAPDTLRWLAPFSDEPGYARAVEAAISSAVSVGNTSANDPAEIAALLDDQSPEILSRQIALVADAWARRDAAAAARWVETAPLPDSARDKRTTAYQNIASRWAERDHEAAREWALGFGRGEQRDSVLSNVLHAMARGGRIDAQVLAAFSTDEARESALASALPSLGQIDPERARRLIAELVTDPQLRARAEAALVRGNRIIPGITFRGEVVAQ